MLFTDHLNNTIELHAYPKRIVSLVPSQSEFLWDLGLKQELVGITKFCIHPKEMFRSLKRVGGTKTVNIESIRALKPDLIIGNKEENEKSQIEALQQEFNVWMSDIYTLNDALKTMRDIGELTNNVERAVDISKSVETNFKHLVQVNKLVLYLIWKPYMAAGKATFIGDILLRLGLKNVVSEKESRYPQLTVDDIKHLNPQLIFLSSEPFPFKEKHIAELQQHLPDTTITLVDGELFSWYGSRLLKSAAYFEQESKKWK